MRNTNPSYFNNMLVPEVLIEALDTTQVPTGQVYTPIPTTQVHSAITIKRQEEKTPGQEFET